MVLPMFSRIASRLKALWPVRQRDRASEQEYSQRLADEQRHYDECLDVHALPDIFHYWSNAYLVPMFEPFGFTNPNDFFLRYFREKCVAAGQRDVHIVSVGAGNCDLELELAQELIRLGCGNFRFVCIEINRNMLERARAAAREAGLQEHFGLLQEDFNRWRPQRGAFDVIMANQSLHHVVELEHLFDSVREGLAADGVFLVSDMIGRNGHQRWPEALRVVQEFWQELPQEYRYNQLLQRHEEQYINHDCSSEGFEGIRAQDILPLLLERFHFRLFIPYGNCVFVFIDRPFGHNFDATAEWDRDFIDRVHARDEQGFLDGSLKPTSMLAALSLSDGPTELRNPELTPAFCVREPDAGGAGADQKR